MRAQARVQETGFRLRAASILMGIAAAYAFSVVAAALLGLLMFRVRVPDPTATLVMSIVSYLSMAAGGLVGARHAGGSGWAHGGLTGVGYVAVGLVLTGLLFPGTLALLPAIQRFGLGFVLGAIGGTIGVNLG